MSVRASLLAGQVAPRSQGQRSRATQLKNIAEPVHIYSLEVGQSGEAKPTSAATAAVKPESEAPAPRSSGWSSHWPALAAIAALVLLAATGGWSILGGRLTKPAQLPRFSIVVLPFANLSGDPAQDYLADSLTDELTTALARIRDSFVIARNTAFTFKGKPVNAKAIGKDLGVRYVLEGSVLPSATQVRVNAQLIDADSGAQLWADQFDAARNDLLQMQDEVVTRLARAMDIQLLAAEAARLKRAPAANPDAEDLALQCVAAVQKSGYFGKDADAGSGLCEKALSIDPNNVRALTMLSIKIYFSVISGSSADTKVDFKRAEELASRGLALDPNYASAHYAMARVLNRQGRFDEAIAENERALALDPAMVAAYGLLGLDYMYLGEFEKSLEFSDKAIRLSPHDRLWFFGTITKRATTSG
jgi:adenylate cyclase